MGAVVVVEEPLVPSASARFVAEVSAVISGWESSRPHTPTRRTFPISQEEW